MHYDAALIVLDRASPTSRSLPHRSASPVAGTTVSRRRLGQDPRGQLDYSRAGCAASPSRSGRPHLPSRSASLGAYFAPSMLCASGPGRDTCAGDSGGPLVGSAAAMPCSSGSPASASAAPARATRACTPASRRSAPGPSHRSARSTLPSRAGHACRGVAPGLPAGLVGHRGKREPGVSAPSARRPRRRRRSARPGCARRPRGRPRGRRPRRRSSRPSAPWSRRTARR